MKLRKYPTLARAADALSKQGFTARFALEDKKLRQVNGHRVYQPEDVAIVEYHRFISKNRDFGKVAIVFALEKWNPDSSNFLNLIPCFVKIFWNSFETSLSMPGVI
mgnify:CR=1 FL=1